MSKNTGTVSQIIGPVVDVTFENIKQGLPDIYDSLVIKKENGEDLILECQQHIGEDTVRTISMDSTDGLSRGTMVKATGSPIKMRKLAAIWGYLIHSILFRITTEMMIWKLFLLTF